MNQRLLSNRHWNLLVEVISKRQPELQPLKIQPELIDKLCDIVTDEFCKTGLGEDDEPNSRGLDLEDLIDALQEAKRKEVPGTSC